MTTVSLAQTAMQSKLTFMIGRGTLLAKKYSPEMLLGAGLIGMGLTIFLAAKATLKVDEVLEEPKKELLRVEEAKQTIDPQKYSEEDYVKDLVIVYSKAGLKMLTLYGPALAVGSLSVAAILSSHGIMKNRNLALVGAFNLANEAFKQYRSRVTDELGEDADRKFHFGMNDEDIVEITEDESGKKTKTKKGIRHFDPSNLSQYMAVFDSECAPWQPRAEFNTMFIESQQIFANRKLQSVGHVFLNDVYRSLGLPDTKAGAVCGWVKGHGDDRIDFMMYDIASFNNTDLTTDYRLTGRPEGIVLDFNVDGVILEMLDRQTHHILRK